MTWELTPVTSSDAWLCTTDDVKNRRGITGTESDTVIETIIAAVQAAFEGYCGRYLIQTAADVTENYTGQGLYLRLKRYPIISITSIKDASDYDFDNAEAWVADEDYRIVANGTKGILYTLLGYWDEVPDSIQVIYRGGYCPAGSSPGVGETAVPDDLREAAILQAVYNFQRKDDLGLQTVSGTGGSIAKPGDADLLGQVKRILDDYRLKTL